MADLTTIRNIGPRIAADLHRIGIHEPDDLRGLDGDELYERLCAHDGMHHDICLRDTFVAAIAYVTTGDDRPWWMHSRERLAAAGRERST
ncbi:MAG TPA: helix-hairpin-helix domain-containing protein [Baekduia sp.]|uniref:helix-hairpin-helix domain-containing protein n=1 Tax=Baekduia sp. TaxID=2600305 RepID=UPI002CCBE6E9|nr:helix-hairpin-helix domain-containing protein [Baekduia sp.]HMJ35658.1 helix-hairpin-helix domain-containing protein [Baekduia sp.]